MQLVNVHLKLEQGAKSRIVADDQAPLLMYGETIISAASPDAARDLAAALLALADETDPFGEVTPSTCKPELAELIAALSDDDGVTARIYGPCADAAITPKIERIRKAISNAERVLGY